MTFSFFGGACAWDIPKARSGQPASRERRDHRTMVSSCEEKREDSLPQIYTILVRAAKLKLMYGADSRIAAV
jgi:hypothetical protein